MIVVRQVASMFVLPVILGVGAASMARAVRNPPTPPIGSPIVVLVDRGPLESGCGIHPGFGDFDGDGRPDLLIGDDKGELRIFRNIGQEGRHDFAAPAWFHEIADDGRIPVG